MKRGTITLPPPGYSLQKISDMKRVFTGIGFKTPYDPVTIADLANAFAAKMRNLDVEFKPMLLNDYEQKLKVFLQALDPFVVSGGSPLAKAANYYAMMTNLGLINQPDESQEQSEESDDSGSDNQEFEQVDYSQVDPTLTIDIDSIQIIPVESDDFGEEGDENAIENSDVGKIAIFLTSNEPSENNQVEPADPNLLVLHINNEIMIRRDFVGTIAAKFANVKGRIPETMQIPSDIIELIRNISILKNLPLVHSKRLPQKIEIGPMTTHSEVARLHSKVQMLHPLFGLKLAKRNLNVRKKIQNSEGAQDVIFAIDSSGSMGDFYKMSWVRAIQMHMYGEVIAGKANIILIPYEVNAFFNQAIQVQSEADVEAYLKWFPNFALSATNIEKTARQIVEGVLAGKVGNFEIAGRLPHIVFVQDGDDPIKSDYVPEIPIHAFTLGQSNDSVKRMCEDSGGSYQLFYDATSKAKFKLK